MLLYTFNVINSKCVATCTGLGFEYPTFHMLGEREPTLSFSATYMYTFLNKVLSR